MSVNRVGNSFCKPGITYFGSSSLEEQTLLLGTRFLLRIATQPFRLLSHMQ